MVYADVVVGIRGSSEELTYAVSAKIIPYIRVGSLVMVPVRKRLAQAVVVKIHQRVDSTLRDRVREIYSIDKNHPGISASQMAVAENLAKNYLTNLSDIVFRMLSSLRPIKVEKYPGSTETICLQASWRQRADYYQQQAEKFQETLIIFPTNAHCESFLKSSQGKIGSIILDGTARSRKKVLALKEPSLFLGTVGDSFFPIRPGGLMIVDQPEHLGSSYSSRPFLRSMDIAKERAKSEGLNLIIGQSLFGFKQLYDAQAEKSQLKSLSLPKLAVTVVSRKGGSELLADSVKERLKNNLDKKRRTLIFVASKGWSTGLFCKNCQELFQCKNCSRIIGADANQLTCRYCGYQAKKPNICLNCGLAELVEVGEGIDKYADTLKKLFPETGLQVIAGKSGAVDQSKELTVATEKILSFPDVSFDDVVVASADRSLTGSSLNDSWKLLSALREISSGAESIVVQTYLIDHPVWAALNPDNLRSYFASELEQRKKFRLPPYSEQLLLTGTHSSDKGLELQTDKLEELLNRKFPTSDYLSLLHPLPNGQFQAQLSIIFPRNVYLLAVNTLADALEPNWSAIPG